MTHPDSEMENKPADLADATPYGERGSNVRVWLALAVVLALYVFAVLRTRPIASWSAFLDSGMYFSSAKALASGHGYILPGFPGHLTSMKYPELFPLILAGVWKLDPHFPGNVPLAVGVAIAFGCLALLLSFLMLRDWPGLGDWPALAIVVLVGFSMKFGLFSAAILTDIPFMAFMLGAAWLSERSLAREPGTSAAVAAGVLAGMSVGMRSVGITVAGGIGLLFLFRRKFRRLLWFCLPGLPLTLLWSWPQVSRVLGLSTATFVRNPTQSGWTQTVCYFSSYACQWKMSVPDMGAFKSALLVSLHYVIQEPGMLLLSPLVPANELWSLVFVMLLSVAAYVGIARHWRREGARPLSAIFPLYLLVVVGYPFVPDRFLIPFSPLFFAGLWLEGSRGLATIRNRLKPGCGRDERIAAYVLGVGALALATAVAINLAYTVPRTLGEFGRQQEKILADEQGAFSWIRQQSSPKARIIAYEDGLTYLYTGRKSIRSIYSVTDATGLTDPLYIRRDAAHLADVARHIHASYWLTGPFDYPIQTPAQRALLRVREKELLAAAPVVYRSPDGEVILYDTRCLWPGKVNSCNVAPGNSATGIVSRKP